MKEVLTQKRLKELLNYCPDTGIFTWKVDHGNQTNIGDIAGHTNKSHGYCEIGVFGVTRKGHQLAWLYVYGYIPETEIDHIDRQKTNNSIDNLREVSKSCNIRNCSTYDTNYSGIKGISVIGRKSLKVKQKYRAKFMVCIFVEGRNKTIGRFSSKIEAACARLAAEQCLGWSICDENSDALIYVRENLKNV